MPQLIIMYTNSCASTKHGQLRIRKIHAAGAVRHARILAQGQARTSDIATRAAHDAGGHARCYACGQAYCGQVR